MKAFFISVAKIGELPNQILQDLVIFSNLPDLTL
jgi:hypothetical protein